MLYLANFIFKRNLVSSRWKAAFTISRREVQIPKQKPTLTAGGCRIALVGDQQRRKRTERGLRERRPECCGTGEHLPYTQHWVKTVLVSNYNMSGSVILNSGCSSMAIVEDLSNAAHLRG